MCRTIAGAMLLLLIVFFARGRSWITESHPVDGLYPTAAESGRLTIAPISTRGSSPGSKRPAARAVPDSFAHVPLAFLSRAPADSLILLTGIGPVLAERIVTARSGRGPFTTWEELLSVKGIGPAKLKLLKAQAGVVE